MAVFNYFSEWFLIFKLRLVVLPMLFAPAREALTARFHSSVEQRSGILSCWLSAKMIE